MKIEEMLEYLLDGSEKYPHEFKEELAIAAKLRAAEELASAWDAYDGLTGQLRMDKARDAYESAGDAK